MTLFFQKTGKKLRGQFVFILKELQAIMKMMTQLILLLTKTYALFLSNFFEVFKQFHFKKKIKQKTFHGNEVSSHKCLVEKIIFLLLFFWLLIQFLIWNSARIHKKPHYFMIVIYLIIFLLHERMPRVSIVC